MRRRKGRHAAEPENHERWLITYADLITLLMVFFIVLYAMSKVEESKADALIKSLHNAFNHVVVIETKSAGSEPTHEKPDHVPSPDKTKNNVQTTMDQRKLQEFKKNEQQLQELKQKLQQYIEEHQLQNVIILNDIPRGIEISLKDLILFDSGKAELKQDAYPILDVILGLVKTVDNPINIEGHTDDRAIKTAKFPSNWELSAARALTVLHHFEQNNIQAERLRFTGYGEFKPLVINNTPENRQANRRVNIVILRKGME